jgi:hypothetical protein
VLSRPGYSDERGGISRERRRTMVTVGAAGLIGPDAGNSTSGSVALKPAA